MENYNKKMIEDDKNNRGLPTTLDKFQVITTEIMKDIKYEVRVKTEDMYYKERQREKQRKVIAQEVKY